MAGSGGRDNPYEQPPLPDPVGNLMEVLQFVSSLMTNPVNQLNRIGGADVPLYDPNLTWRDVMQNAGYEGASADVLGILGDVAEPGPGEFASAAKALAAAGITGPSIIRAALSNDTLLRLQNSLTGLGPFQGNNSAGVARGTTAGLTGKYFDSGGWYTRDAIQDLDFTARGSGEPMLKGFEVVYGAPLAGSRIVDMANPDTRAFDQMYELLRNAKNLPPARQEAALRYMDEWKASGRDITDTNDMWRSLTLMLGFDRGGLPHGAGVDFVRQFPDDNIQFDFALRDSEPATEWVAFNPDRVDIQGSMTPDEFLDRMDANDMPQAMRAASASFQDLGPQNVETYYNTIMGMDPAKRGFLTPHSPDELRRMVSEGYRIRMDERGIGYVLSPTGDLQGVINASGLPGMGEAAILDAINNGATTLDAFDGFLPDYYRQFGFEETGRATFDPQYAPADWDYEKYGRPDVVFMRLRGR